MNRRYDIDWIRVIAIGLLLIYHVAIGFQPWGIMIGFIANPKSWMELWTPMAMLNIWRIPLLFFVSGMGVYFASQSRSWKTLIAERMRRILIPLIAGSLLIVPLHIYLWQYYYNMPKEYQPGPAHLWFLANIFAYVMLLSPFFQYMKNHSNGKVVGVIKAVLSHPLGLVLVIVVFIAEAWIMDPVPYELYAFTWHGFVLGLIAFFFGFCFVFSGDKFWSMILRSRWVFLAGALLLFAWRLNQFQMRVPQFQLVTESQLWIFSVLSFGHKYLNKPGKVLSYLSEAVYPVYILHMIFLYMGSIFIFPLNVPAPLQFVMVLLFTLTVSMITYEFIVRRVNLFRLLFGLKLNSSSVVNIAQN
jgi:glucan biosynthesis protein C